MRVEWAVTCRYAEAPGDGSANILGAAVDSVWLAEVPGVVGLYLALRIVGAEYEFEEEKRFEVRVVGPDGTETTVLDLGFSIDEMPPLKVPGMDPGIVVAAGLQWQAQDYGMYTLEVYLDGSRQRSIAVHVRPTAELQAQRGG